MAPFESKNQAMATKISDNGFFSDEAIRKGELIKQEHKQLFFYLAEVNEQAHRYLGLWRVSSTYVKQLFSAALFARALTAYQALILLTQRGYASEARATCRNILEAKFKLAYLFKEPEAAVLLIAKGEKKRADRLRNMKSGALPVPPELANQDWDSIIKKAEEHLKDAKGSKRKLPSMWDIAKKCGLQMDYLGHYSLFSEATHTGHIELETYLKFNVALISLSTNISGYSQGSQSKFDAALKKELLSNHQRHVPIVTVKGNEVKLTYGPELEWTKSAAHDDVARMDALDCFKADYAALKADPKHQLHDYFHVINYSTWSHQVIGEATVKRADYPNAQAVDKEIARTLAEWQRRASTGSPQ